jgi:hypothetical protein
MTKMAVISKRDGSRELQWLSAWGAIRAVEKNEDDAAVRCRPRWRALTFPVTRMPPARIELAHAV